MMPSRSKPEFSASPAVVGSIPAPTPPSDEARVRFAQRRAAGRLADLMAAVVGRSTKEAGTARLALLLTAPDRSAPRADPEVRPQHEARPIVVVRTQAAAPSPR